MPWRQEFARSLNARSKPSSWYQMLWHIGWARCRREDLFKRNNSPSTSPLMASSSVHLLAATDHLLKSSATALPLTTHSFTIKYTPIIYAHTLDRPTHRLGSDRQSQSRPHVRADGGQRAAVVDPRRLSSEAVLRVVAQTALDLAPRPLCISLPISLITPDNPTRRGAVWLQAREIRASTRSRSANRHGAAVDSKCHSCLP